MSLQRLKEEDINYAQIAVNQKDIEPSNSDSPSILISAFGGNPFQKADEGKGLALNSRSFVIQSREALDKNESVTGQGSTLFGNSRKKIIGTPQREFKELMSDGRKDDKPTNSRKHHPFEGKFCKNAGKSDVQRMKLQAELKAAEEIAKLKQTIIEKRLALELATIQNGVESTTMSRCSSHSELRILEQLVKKKQSAIESNLAKELDKLDQSRSQSFRHPPSPTSLPPRVLPIPSQTPRNSNPFRTESTCSVKASLRGLGMLDKKFTLDKPYNVHSTMKQPSNFFPTENRYSEHHDKPAESYSKSYVQPQEYAGNPLQSQQQYERSPFSWKSALAKIKNKLRPKPPPPWSGV